jgi:alpha-1,2-mannosyltransferase
MFRSYAYVGLHALVMDALRRLGVPKPVVFFLVRMSLAAAAALADACLVDAASFRFGPGVASYTLLALLTAAGPLQAASSFLPSTFTMVLFTACVACWLWRQGEWAVLAGAVGVLLGWPFAALVLVPVGLGLVWDAVEHSVRGKASALVGLASVSSMAVVGLVSTAVILGASAVIDKAYYGTWGIAVWEIIKYNALGIGGSGQGADLYGVEPWWWYLANLALNFNVLAVGALLAPLMLLLMGVTYCAGWRRVRDSLPRGDAVAATLVVGATIGWVALMSARAHKEERFMFPVFSLLPLCFGIATEGLVSMVGDVLNLKPGRFSPLRILVLVGIGLSSLISLSRVVGQVMLFGAPLQAWTHVAHISAATSGDPWKGTWSLLENTEAPPVSLHSSTGRPLRFGKYSDEPFGLRVCVGKEWYRFPSALFLPDQTRPHGIEPAKGGWFAPPSDPASLSGGPLVLGFLKSGFGGQLPQPFDQWGNRTAELLPGFNDVNREEPDRYVHPDACDIIVDLQLPNPSDREPWFQPTSEWKPVWTAPFAHADSTPALWRWLWVPGLSQSRVQWGTYSVLLRTPQATTASTSTSREEPLPAVREEL